ncbi:hypothetical protein OG601_37305 [Streptomyces sp. NBC_01239]|uniref:hypothetical protein n=1 Tax=Streptomyces sp. NBC_01239 TaxID=2903792 RepID=UPI00224CD19C|nr:hypothetical protein [Streptomyces sp. NBC_01239]MCX4816265.1 hypothetical protein [Streptomyces sp. NBC_01239]
MTRADFVRQLVDIEARIDIAGLEEASGEPRTALAAARDPKLRAAVAGAWYDRPVTVQIALLADPDPRVRAAATVHPRPGVPPDWRERRVADPAVRVKVAAYVPLTADRFTDLMRTEDEEIRRAVAGNPHLSADMAARLLDVDDPLVRVAVAHSRHVAADTRNRLYALVEAERDAGDIDARVALNWSSTEPSWLREAPLDERMTYLNCPQPVFRPVLASCRDLPEEAWRLLDDDPDLKVRRTAVLPPPRGVARHPRAADALLDQLLSDPTPDVADAAAANSALPPARSTRRGRRTVPQRHLPCAPGAWAHGFPRERVSAFRVRGQTAMGRVRTAPGREPPRGAEPWEPRCRPPCREEQQERPGTKPRRSGGAARPCCPGVPAVP